MLSKKCQMINRKCQLLNKNCQVLNRKGQLLYKKCQMFIEDNVNYYVYYTLWKHHKEDTQRNILMSIVK